MKYDLDRTIVKKTFEPEVIGKWYKIKDYDVRMCQLSAPMFGLILNLVYATYDEWERFMVKYHDRHKDGDDTLACYCWATDPETKGKVKYLLLTENNWTPKDFGTIAHELHHFTHFALDDIGLTYGAAGEELYAYFQGYFMELVVRAMIELKRVEEQTEAKLNGIIHNKKKRNKRKEVAHNPKRGQKDRRTKR